MPHGRVKGLKHSVAAFFRLTHPIAFEAPDQQPVKQLLFLLAPEDAAQQHLDILAEVAQLFSEEAFRLKLADQTDSGVVHRLLTTGSV